MSTMTTFIWLLMLMVLSISFGENAMPIIGVIPQPCMTFGVNLCPYKNSTSYLPAKYVKWIEMGGCQVIPLFPSYTYHELQELIPKLNGIFIVGGVAPTQPRTHYEQFVIDLLDILRHYANDNKPNNVPLWGTCDGFENILTAISKNGNSVMDQYSAMDTNLNITFTQNIGNSKMFNLNDIYSELYPLNKLVIDLMTQYSISYNDHHKGILPEVFETDEYISGNLTNLGISYDQNGKPFVALFESKKELNLNWFAVQFHPENPEFRYGKNVNRSYNAVISNTWFSQFFVNIVKESNDNTMTQQEFEKRGIYNYDPVHEVDEIYYFYDDV